MVSDSPSMTGTTQAAVTPSGIRDRVRRMNEVADGVCAHLRNTLRSIRGVSDDACTAEIAPAPPEQTLIQELADLNLALQDSRSLAVQLQDEVGGNA